MASTISSPDLATRQLVMFRLAERVYGIEVALAREIIPARRATRLPGAPAHVLGLINVRGTIVTVIDLAARLHGGAPARADRWVVLVEHGSRLVGLAVDEVVDVQYVSEAALQRAPGAMLGERSAVHALGRMGDELIVLVDVSDIISQVLA